MSLLTIVISGKYLCIYDVWFSYGWINLWMAVPPGYQYLNYVSLLMKEL